MKSKLARRVFAGAWFAFLAVIPVAFYFLVLWRKTERQDAIFVWTFIGAPILLAGICGSIFGSSILDPDKVKTPKQAKLRGLLVAVLAYVLFFPVSGEIIAQTSKDPVKAIDGWPAIFIMGMVLVGWLIALTGVVGGALLYNYRVKSARDKQQK